MILILKEQSDQGLFYLPLCLHLLDALLYGKAMRIVRDFFEIVTILSKGLYIIQNNLHSHQAQHI